MINNVDHQNPNHTHGSLSREGVSQGSSPPADLTTQDDQLQPNLKSSPTLTLPIILSALADAKLTPSSASNSPPPRRMRRYPPPHPLHTNDSSCDNTKIQAAPANDGKIREGQAGSSAQGISRDQTLDRGGEGERVLIVDVVT
ncbi:hypothetical protein CaCOL14_010827 [Colletotrichum acutatum]